ncbi:MAG: DUF1844 domain-containing protein [Desulfovibrionaceae bacterium]|nr:DUF1844 domain-containing protein [Desulfovibrionaceae bacterium]MBF0512963.1 DUF1844 domain-containing protein [Desulfovibrionaceae bacterium]
MSDERDEAGPTSPNPDCYALPEPSFTTFMLSLASSALVHLGETPDPDSGQYTPNLALAKHTIDILAMLQKKTSGNLAEEESRVLEHMLCQLRLAYVSKTK